MTRKIIFIFIITIIIALAGTACSKSEAPVAPAYGGIPEIGEDVDNSEPYEESPDKSNYQHGGLETGIIVYYDGSTLIICTNDSRNLHLFVAEDEVDKSETGGLALGSEVDVYYTGVINGSDASAAQVTRLVQNQSQAVVRTDVSVIGGIILESDGAALRITTLDGEEQTFHIGESVDKSNAKGLETGDYVTVFYEGGTTGTETGDVTVTKLVQ